MLICNFQPVINGTEAFLSRITGHRNMTRPLLFNFEKFYKNVTTSQTGLMINIAYFIKIQKAERQKKFKTSKN